MGNNLYSNLVNFYNVNDENFKEFMAELYKKMLITHRDVQYVKEHLSEEIEKKLEIYLVDGKFNINIEEKVNEFLENNQEIKDITSKLIINTNKIEDVNTKLNTNTSNIENISSQLDNKASLNISNLNDEIDFSIYSEIPYPNGYTVQQGACTTDNYIILGLTNDDDSNSIIRVYDKTSLNFINEFSGQFYHINSITFNNDTKKIIITHCIANGVDKNTISIIAESELIKSTPIVETKTLSNFTQVQAIGYGNGKYYLNSTNNNNTIYVLDENFNIVNSFKTSNGSILQDIEYYNDLLFITRINLSSGNISDELTKAFSSVIEVYKVNGEYVKSYIIPSKAQGNEIEAFFNYDNGTFLSVWKGFNASVLMLSRVYNNPLYKVTEIKEDYAWQSAIMNIYIDKTKNNVLCDGSSEKPFKSISQAMKYIYTNSNVNEININIVGDFSNENIHLKNKMFTLNFSNGGKIKGINGRNSTIRLNNIDMLSNEKGLNLDGCSVMINGNCKLSSTGENVIHSTNSKIYASGNSLTLEGKPVFLSHSEFALNCNMIINNIGSFSLRGSRLHYTVSNCKDLIKFLSFERGSTAFTSGWVNINYSEGFTGYSENYDSVRVSLNGNQICLIGIMKPTVTIPGGTDKVVICTLPSNLRPLTEQNFICHGSSTNTYMITIETNGNVSYSRYTNNTTYIETPTSAWLPYAITYSL